MVPGIAENRSERSPRGGAVSRVVVRRVRFVRDERDPIFGIERASALKERRDLPEVRRRADAHASSSDPELLNDDSSFAGERVHDQTGQADALLVLARGRSSWRCTRTAMSPPPTESVSAVNGLPELVVTNIVQPAVAPGSSSEVHGDGQEPGRGGDAAGEAHRRGVRGRRDRPGDVERHRHDVVGAGRVGDVDRQRWSGGIELDGDGRYTLRADLG